MATEFITNEVKLLEYLTDEHPVADKQAVKRNILLDKFKQLLHSGGGIPDAPADGTLYGRENATWQPVSSSIAGVADVNGGVSDAYVDNTDPQHPIVKSSPVLSGIKADGMDGSNYAYILRGGGLGSSVGTLKFNDVPQTGVTYDYWGNLTIRFLIPTQLPDNTWVNIERADLTNSTAVLYKAGGGGGSETLDQVLTNGNTTDQDAVWADSTWNTSIGTGGVDSSTIDGTFTVSGVHGAGRTIQVSQDNTNGTIAVAGVACGGLEAALLTEVSDANTDNHKMAMFGFENANKSPILKTVFNNPTINSVPRGTASISGGIFITSVTGGSASSAGGMITISDPDTSNALLRISCSGGEGDWDTYEESPDGGTTWLPTSLPFDATGYTTLAFSWFRVTDDTTIVTSNGEAIEQGSNNLNVETDLTLKRDIDGKSHQLLGTDSTDTNHTIAELAEYMAGEVDDNINATTSPINLNSLNYIVSAQLTSPDRTRWYLALNGSEVATFDKTPGDLNSGLKDYATGDEIPFPFNFRTYGSGNYEIYFRGNRSCDLKFATELDDQIEIGSESIHLNLNTNHSPVYDNHITVDTPYQKEVVAYQSDLWFTQDNFHFEEVSSGIACSVNIQVAGASLSSHEQLAQWLQDNYFTVDSNTYTATGYLNYNNMNVTGVYVDSGDIHLTAGDTTGTYDIVIDSTATYTVNTVRVELGS